MDYSGHVDSTYLDMAAQILSAAKRRTYELMGLQVGHRVLDLGCGPASDTIALADLVGETGEVHGVDFDPEMVEEANVRAKAAGLDERVLHRQADAAALPFDDDLFDACRSERVFQHLPDPAAGLAEMIRVTRPGGRIVVLDTDFGSLSIASEVSELERTVAEHYRSMMNSPFAGRMLYRSFKAVGLDDVSVEIVPIAVDDLGVFSEAFVLARVLEAAEDAGVLTDDEVRHFRADLEQAAEIGGFFASVQQLLVTGRKPDATAGA
ncbi:MAG TPA: methyltransferase domain-containing protein [Ilumatobacteraceae bacterium]|nr:methyltransferase domain-containing protein [Ilumatobacteraceae bacterium]